MDLIGILSITCIMLFGMLGIFLLIGIRQRSHANVFLGVFFILWAFNFLDGWLSLNGFYLKFPSLAMWEEPFALLYGPLIYFYSKLLTRGSAKPYRKFIPHLIPFAILFMILLFSFHIKPEEFKLTILNSLYELQPAPRLLIPTITVFTHIFIYIFLTIRILKEYNVDYKNYHSIQTKWLGQILRYLITILILSLSVSVIQNFFSPTIFRIGIVILIISIFMLIVWIYFNAFQDPNLFLEASGSKYQSNPLTEEDITRIEQKILETLEVRKSFLKPELTIYDLAQGISEAPRSVSQVINEKFKKTFFDLINSYRIKESEAIIKQNTDPGKTVLEVMYESGFNSKSSFNTQFKKYTGLTPSEYKKLNSEIR